MTVDQKYLTKANKDIRAQVYTRLKHESDEWLCPRHGNTDVCPIGLFAGIVNVSIYLTKICGLIFGVPDIRFGFICILYVVNL